MAKRLILGSIFVAGLVFVAICSQAPVLAFWSQPAVPAEAQPAAKPMANNLPQYSPVRPGATAWVEETVTESSGAVRTVLASRGLKELQERYVWHHQQIADKLTMEQLAEKCNALRRESLGLSAEDEIERIQKQLSELKQKDLDNKGISTRVQRAIEALKDTGKSAGGREL